MQKTLQGRGSLEQLPLLLREAGCQSVLIITGHHLANHEFVTGIPQHRYIKKGMNVSRAEMEQATAFYRDKSRAAIVAIGGGSVIDLAKMIVWQSIQADQPAPFFVAVPTTAGSGSEATHFAVLYENGEKLSVVDPALKPGIAILDANLLDELSPRQVGISGMDAVSQAIESWWSKAATHASRELAEDAIWDWRKSFLLAIAGDRDAREILLNAAHLAGRAIDITRTTGPHALSYYLTSTFGVQHGQAVAIFLPLFVLYNRPDEKLLQLFGAGSPEQLFDSLRDTLRAAGLSTTLAELGIAKEHIIEPLLSAVNMERFANNPRAFDPAALKELIHRYL